MNNITYISVALAVIIILCIGICAGKWLNTSNKKDKMYIKQEISSTHKITPNTFSINLTITANQRLKNTSQLTKDQKDSILIASNKINTLVQEAKEICIGGSFAFNPKQYYVREKIGNRYENKEIWGFYFNQHIECEFNDSQKNIYENLLAQIHSIIDTNIYLQTQIPEIIPIITKEQIDNKQQEMRDEILIKAKDITINYSKILHTKCAISNIRFDNYKSSQPLRYKTENKKNMDIVIHEESTDNNITAAMPIVKENEISIGADFDIICE